MKKLIDDVRLMIKVCNLYYLENIGQQQIAAMLNISRPTVSRLLSSSKEQGIVKIQISDLDAIKHWELERQLKERYGLKDVLIVDSMPTEEETLNLLGTATAKYLERTIKDDDIVGISMGSTLHRVISKLERPNASNVTFVPLIGGMGQLRMELHSNNLAESLSRKYNGRFVPLQAPARVSSLSVRRELMKEESIAAALRLGERADLSIVGIGYPNEKSSIKATGYFKENEVDSLVARHVTGEICMQFYDIHGESSPYKNDNLVIGMPLHKLRKIPCSIGIAGGISKLQSIQGAIKGKYINVLITDFDCANALINSPGGDA
ncbi:MAG: sugar-binding transcriptional regulator [Lachnospiraceae bacterium]|nr:sugar-binding transcriptional regulator [Lachnospiraceae bacterium]